MPDLQIRRDHQLGLAKARKIAWAWAEEAESKFSMECTVLEGETSDTIRFTRSGVNGTLIVAPDHFELEAKLGFADGSSDDLPADDHAYALLPERRRARVQVVTTGNMYLEAALLLDEYLDVTTVAPGAYPAKGSFDVTIFDGVSPVIAPASGGLLYLNPPGGNTPFEVGKLIEDNDPNYRLGFDELDEKSPLLRYTALSDVNIGRGHHSRYTRRGGPSSAAAPASSSISRTISPKSVLLSVVLPAGLGPKGSRK